MGSKEQGADATSGRWLVIPRTLCFVFHDNHILLMKRGPHRRVFPNQYNGLGGHVERNEDPASCAQREIFEESGLIVRDVRLRAVYNVDAGAESGIALYVYTAKSTSREISVETDEGKLEWVHVNDVFELDLVEDLPIILPRILDSDECAPVLSAHASYDDKDSLRMQFFGTDGGRGDVR